MKKSLIITLFAIIALLTLLMSFSEYSFWYRGQKFDDVIVLRCKFKSIDCAVERFFYSAKGVSNTNYYHLINSNIEIICDNEVVVCDSINKITYKNKELVLIGKLYKKKATSGIYDCNVDAYRFYAYNIIIK